MKLKAGGTPETECAIEQAVDALLACPKGTENNVIRKLQKLWTRRKNEIAAATLSTLPIGPTPATEASSLVPAESDTVTISTGVVPSTVANDPISH